MKYTIDGKEHTVGFEHIITAGLVVLTGICVYFVCSNGVHLVG